MKNPFKRISLTTAALSLFAASANGVVIGGLPDPDSPDLIGWWDASDASSFTFNAGNQVNTWASRSTENPRVATISGGTSITRDTYLNGTSTVTFTGTDIMTLDSVLSMTIGLSGDASAFVVAKTTDASGQDTIMSTTSNVQFFRQTNSQVRFYKGTNPDPSIDGDALTTNRIRYAEWFGGPGPGNNTGTMNYVVDGSPLTVSNAQNIGPQNWDLSSIGGRPLGGCCGNWNGDIAEILLFDRALTPQEQEEIGFYLETKYGISTSYVPEPGSSTLLVMTILGLSLRRRR